MEELAQLFQDVEAAVVEQEDAVVDIETKAENTNANVGKANVEIDGAIESARARNRKKWWCLFIVCESPQPLIPFARTPLISNSGHYCPHYSDRSRRDGVEEERVDVTPTISSLCNFFE